MLAFLWECHFGQHLLFVYPFLPKKFCSRKQQTASLITYSLFGFTETAWHSKEQHHFPRNLYTTAGFLLLSETFLARDILWQRNLQARPLL